MVHVGVVDDNSSVRSKICRILTSEPGLNIVMNVSDGLELLNCLNTQKQLPDVLLVDINMPRIDGVTLTDFLTDNFPAIRVVGVSTYAEQDTINDMFECGAWGYVLKPHIESCLVPAIKAVLRDEVYLSLIPKINFTCEMRAALIAKRAEKKALTKNLGITKREHTFISLNATGLEYSEIANLMFVERKTLDRFFANISKKIEVKNRHNLALYSLRHGLVKIARYSGAPRIE
jgi:DNA-binding NarL/FixJ family response regulator